ncbi:MAG: SH3 domain-containing protein [Thermomicrobiales bacterium]|nr:SH3 domain-containing protein [Thermomicrobiales bacterium]
MQPADAIVAASRGIVETAVSAARQRGAARMNDVEDYIDEVYRLAGAIGFDASIIIAQSVLETDYWRSYWWQERLNPAGLGITGDPQQNENSQTFTSGQHAARAHLAHMHAYVHGNTQSLHSDLVGADSRYQAVFDANLDDTVSTISDLNNRWAIDNEYAAKIATRGNTLYGLSLDSYSGGAPSGSIIGLLPVGNEVCITDGPQSANGFEWYKVNSEPVAGWIAGEYCTLVRTGGCVSTPAGRFASNDKIQVFDGPLRVRQSASTSSAVLSVVESGTELCVSNGPTYAGGYEWYQVPGGWIAGDFCNLVRQGGCAGATSPGKFTVHDRVVVTNGPLNIRNNPSTSAQVTGSYATSSQFCVTQGPVFANGYEWYKSSLGWSAGQFCDLVSANACNPANSGPFTKDDRIYVANGPLNVRSAPSTSAAVLGKLSSGAEACVLDGPVSASSYVWYRVRSAGIEGWVAAKFCGITQYGGCRTTVSRGRFDPGDTVEIFDGPANLRESPTVSASVVITYGTWTDFCVLDGPVYADGYDWYEVSRYGNTGWIAGAYLGLYSSGGCAFAASEEPIAIAPVDPSGVSVGEILVVPEKTAPVSVRNAANPTAPVIISLPVGSLGIVTAGPAFPEDGSWYTIRTGAVMGWVRAIDLEKAFDFVNRVANPSAEVDLAYICANAGSTTIDRELTDGRWAVEAHNLGTAQNEGVRFSSESGLGLTGPRFVAGTVEVAGSGTVDAAIVRIVYTDASTIESDAASLVNLSETNWQRIAIPRAPANHLKTIDRVELLVLRDNAAGNPWSLYARNARLVDI